MKKYLVLLLMLVGCTDRNYVAANSISQVSMKPELQKCIDEAVHKYYSDKNSDAGLYAGLLGGAVGGAIGGAAAGGIVGGGMVASSSMESKDIDPYIDTCMKKRGFQKAEK